MALFTFPAQAVSIPGAATEVTLLQVEANTDAAATSLASIDSKVLTDAQLRASAVPVIGPITDAELRASAVPVSGPLTDAQLRATAVPTSVASLPLPSGAATEATLAAAKTDLDHLDARLAGSLVPEEHDYINIAYVGATTDVQTVVYKLGGAAGTTVATLTLAYDGSNRLQSVTRS